MFTAYPTYSKFRTLKLTSPQMRGEDVYALQNALVSLGYSVGSAGADGFFGSDTDKGVRKFQESVKAGDPKFVVDGLAGGGTQKAAAVKLAESAAFESGVPIKRLYGQLEHESSFRLGIYSIQYDNGSYDAGVAQRNTALTPPQEGFEVEDSINALAARVKEYYTHFEGIPTDRRWDLAQGAWNAPAWACYLAHAEGANNSWVAARKSRSLSDAQRARIETYIASVSAYA